MTTPAVPEPKSTETDVEKYAALLVKAKQLSEGDSAHNPTVAAYAEVIRELLAIISMLLSPETTPVDERLEKAFTESYNDARDRAR